MKAVGGNHGNKGPALPPLRLLGGGCKQLQQDCTADCRAGSRPEAGVGLGWWEYLESV